MPLRPEVWLDRRVRRLAELWPDPTWTVRAIAHELGVGREAVRWRAKKLGLRGRPKSVSDPWPSQLSDANRSPSTKPRDR
jgi:hypothetical protein